jgi:fermentation-respiration switch protein FrsA (DUF1100 family)
MEVAREPAVSRLSAPARGLSRVAAVVGREYILFCLGVGAIAIHVLDDSFMLPEPGTSAGDHLVSGLVPVAVLALIAAVYSRFRAGLRGAIALTIGFLGVVGGASEAGYYTISLGPERDDYTGLLMIAAGLLLLALGAVTLWKTRRRDRSLARRCLRRALTGAGSAVLAYQLLSIAYAYGFTHAARAVVPEARLGTSYQDVTFTTSDGLKLAGWYIPSRNGAAVIAFPGRKGPQKHARMLARHGYGVLLFDRRGEGASEGDPEALGWVGDRDVEAAIAFLARRPEVERDRVGGLGLSTGGEVLLQTAALSTGLKAVVSEGAGIRSIREELDLPGVMKWALAAQWSVSTAATAVFSNHLPPPNLNDLVGRIAPRPVFLIYAREGQGGEQELNPRFYAAAREPKTLWGIVGSAHTGGISARPREYERRVVQFFDRALLEGDAQ